MYYMSSPFRFSALAAALFATSTAWAQQDGPSVDAAQILRELDAIETKQKQTLQTAKQQAINLLRPGAAGGSAASGLYESAIEATQFQGLKDKVPAFIEWKKKNTELLRSREMQAALGMHLQYLVMSLERGSAPDAAPFAIPSMQYVGELVKAKALLQKQEKPPKEPKELLDKSLNDSVFVRWLNLGPWLPAASSWELNPGNISGILDKNVRPVWREAKDVRLLESWDFQMQAEADRITTGRLDHEADQFNTVTRPKLQFSRANDMAQLGMQNRAVAEIVGLVRTYPQHPDFASWVKKLREMLKSSAPAAVAPAAPVASPAAPTAPAGS